MHSGAPLHVVRPYFNGWELWDLGCQTIDPLKDPLEIAVTVDQENGPLITYPSAKQGERPDILFYPFRDGHLRLDFNDRIVASHVAWTMNQQVRLGIACIQSGQD